MRLLLPLAAALLGACGGWVAARSEAALRGPMEGLTMMEEVSRTVTPALVYIPNYPVGPLDEETATPSPVVISVPPEWPDQLSLEQMHTVLDLAGWPPELHEQAIRVAHCESSYSPGAIGDHGASLGLFQVNVRTWFPYAGEDAEQWADPVVNARVALAAYNYSAGWAQWTCKP